MIYKHFKLILTIVLFSIAAFNFILPISTNWNKFTEKFNPKVYEKKYNNSQYVIPQSKTPISDEELLSYAGYRYALGMNPVLINSDHPPLGKYIIGWTTLLFNNNRIVSLLFAIGNILLLSLIVYKLTKSLLLVALGALFLSLDTVFLDQIIYSPILDIIHIFFIMLYLFLLIKWSQKQKPLYIILLGITLGSIAAIKIYFSAIIGIIVTTIFFITVTKKIGKSLLKSSIVFAFSIFVYSLTYFMFFLDGNSLRGFLGAQKWIFLFWKNNSVASADYYGNIVPFVLFNQWKVWWGDKQYISFEHWSLFWSITFILGILISSFFILLLTKEFILKKKLPTIVNPLFTYSLTLFSFWSILYTIYLCFIPVSPRYLMMIFFPMYIVIILFIKVKLIKYV